MERNKDKWIEDAFKKAQMNVDGMSVGDFAKKITEAFKKDFPRTMTAYQMSHGDKKGAKFLIMFLTDPDILQLCECFFSSGYVYRMKEDKGEG